METRGGSMNYANKGKALEELVEYANKQYKAKGWAQIQKISTPWVVVRGKNGKITSAFPEGKSTLDFRGTVDGGLSISFDCKETTNKKGLPLSNIQDHQLEFIRDELKLNAASFILVHIKTIDGYFVIHGETVIKYWDLWKKNFRKRGYNFIPVEAMEEVVTKNGVALDYLEVACKC